MIKICKRCHRKLNVQNVEYCHICQSDIDRHSKNNWSGKNGNESTIQR
jgi:RNA polymerase subunit RPABC4/transcription elongation factor Spt4